MSIQFKRYTGFTLAEVLITLGIIGVVAAMTIPTLMANSQKAQYLTGIKKFYSEFSTALKLYVNSVDCNGNLDCAVPYTTNVASTNVLGKGIVQNYKTIKDCGGNMGEGDCFPSSIKGLVSAGYNENHNNDQMYRIMTADGMSIGFFRFDCLDEGFGEGDNLVCAHLIVDTNGLKGPNKIGRDAFWFYILKSTNLAPWGSSLNAQTSLQWNNAGADNSIKCDSTNPASQGMGCSARVIEEGWAMNY